MAFFDGIAQGFIQGRRQRLDRNQMEATSQFRNRQLDTEMERLAEMKRQFGISETRAGWEFSEGHEQANARERKRQGFETRLQKQGYEHSEKLQTESLDHALNLHTESLANAETLQERAFRDAARQRLNVYLSKPGSIALEDDTVRDRGARMGINNLIDFDDIPDDARLFDNTADAEDFVRSREMIVGARREREIETALEQLALRRTETGGFPLKDYVQERGALIKERYTPPSGALRYEKAPSELEARQRATFQKFNDLYGSSKAYLRGEQPINDAGLILAPEDFGHLARLQKGSGLLSRAFGNNQRGRAILHSGETESNLLTNEQRTQINEDHGRYIDFINGRQDTAELSVSALEQIIRGLFAQGQE